MARRSQHRSAVVAVWIWKLRHLRSGDVQLESIEPAGSGGRFCDRAYSGRWRIGQALARRWPDAPEDEDFHGFYCAAEFLMAQRCRHPRVIVKAEARRAADRYGRKSVSVFVHAAISHVLFGDV